MSNERTRNIGEEWKSELEESEQVLSNTISLVQLKQIVLFVSINIFANKPFIHFSTIIIIYYFINDMREKKMVMVFFSIKLIK